MGHPDGAHTHGSGGSGGTIALVVGAAALAAAVAGPVAAAAAELARIVVTIVIVVLGLALAAAVAAVALRLRQRRANGTTQVSFPRAVSLRPSQALPAPRRSSIEAPREVHIHIHGANAEDIAAVLRQLPDSSGR